MSINFKNNLIKVIYIDVWNWGMAGFEERKK
jgi:hypothetical protein